MPANQAHANRLKGLDQRADYVRYHADGYTKDTKGLGYSSSNFTDTDRKKKIDETIQGPPKPDNVAVRQIIGKQSGLQPNSPDAEKKGSWQKVGRGPALSFTKRPRSWADKAMKR